EGERSRRNATKETSPSRSGFTRCETQAPHGLPEQKPGSVVVGLASPIATSNCGTSLRSGSPRSTTSAYARKHPATLPRSESRPPLGLCALSNLPTDAPAVHSGAALPGGLKSAKFTSVRRHLAKPGRQ